MLKKVIASFESMLSVLFRVLRDHGSRLFLRSTLKTNTAVLQSVDKNLEDAHRDYWATLGKAHPAWLRFYVNMSGIEDEKYVPGNLYFSRIEHRLNDADQNDLLNNKNIYEKWFGPEVLPKAFMRCMSGTVINSNYTPANDAIHQLPRQNLILKPSMDTSNGSGVHLLRYEDGRHIMADGKALSSVDLQETFGEHFIVQEVLPANDFTASFNPSSLNTFRVYTYRSVKDEQVHVLKVFFRSGTSEAIIDHQAAGGVAVVVNLDGSFCSYGSTINGEKHEQHPASGIRFEGSQVPNFSAILELAVKIASQVPSHRTLGLDIAQSLNNEPKLIEVNPMGVALDPMQCNGGPLFGEFTDEVRDYCAEHPEKERKRIIRP